MTFFLVVIITIGMQIYFHEFTHVQIMKYYGCEHIGTGFEDGSVFVIESCPTQEMYDKAVLAHSINEIVGYNITPYLILIVNYLFLLMVISVLKK